MPVARSVRPDEVERAGDVGAIAFEGESGDWRRSFAENVERHGHDAVIVAEHDGQIVSSMQLIPEPMRFGDVTLPAVAVAGVGTVPEARRVGSAAAMMQEAARRMRAWGAAASPMWPFSFVYYRKFGWEIGGEVRVVTWKHDVAWKIAPRGDASEMTMDDVQAVSALWDAESARHRCATGVEGRDYEGRFRRHLGQAGWGGLMAREGGRALGYAVYRIPETKEGEEPKPVEVLEMCAEDAHVEVGLFNALAERVDRPAIEAHRPVDDRLRSVAVNPRDLETRLGTSFGFRVVDPPQILSTMRTDAALAPVTIHVEDALLGSGAWRVSLPGGTAQVEKTGAEPDVSCSIQTFSQIASGFLKPDAAFRLGLLTGDAAAARRLHAATFGWTLPFRAPTERG